MKMHETLHLTAEASVRDVEFPCGPAESYRIVLHLHNECSGALAFKCKTNAAERWLVRPNCGVLDPDASIEVVFKLALQSPEAAMLAAAEFDRHLILSAPVSALDAARLRLRRQQHPRSSLDIPNLDTTGTSQLRVTPRFGTAVNHAGSDHARMCSPPPVPSSKPNGNVGPPTAEAIAAAAAAAQQQQQPIHSPSFVSPMPSPMLPQASFVGAAAGSAPLLLPQTPLAKQQSVAERVAALNGRLSPPDASGLRSASSGASALAVGRGGLESCEREEADGGSYGNENPFRNRASLARYVLSLVSRGSEEVLPWLSWKFFDVLFALLMLRLAKRFRCIRRLQELEVL